MYPDGFVDASGVNPTCPHALQGAFTLKNSRASGNWSDITCDGDTPRCYGVKVIVSGLVTITNVEASNNGSDVDCTGHGYQLTKGRGPDGESCFGILAFSVGPRGGVVMTHIVANDNRAAGNCNRHETCFGVMADETLRDVTLKGIETKNNGADGDCSGNDTCFGTAADGVEGKVTMIDVVATDNGAKGECKTASDPYGTIGLNDSCSGVIVDGEDWSLGLTMANVVADRNGAFGGVCSGGDSCSGIIIDGHGGDIVLRGVTANDNGATGNCQGTDMCAGIIEDPSDVVGVFSLSDVQANRNGAGLDCVGSDSCFGILHDTGFCSGDVKFSNVEASYNGAGRNCNASDSCQGIVIDSGDNTGSFIFKHVKANYNGAGLSEPGNCTGTDSCVGILIDGGGIAPIEPAEEVEELVPFCSLFGHGRPKSFSASLTYIEANFNGADGNCTSRDTCSGVLVDGIIGPLTMKYVTANDNKAGSNCSGSTSCFGVTADTDEGDVSLTGIEANRNGAVGSCNYPSSCYGLRAATTYEEELGYNYPFDVHLKKIETVNNTGDGTVVELLATIINPNPPPEVIPNQIGAGDIFITGLTSTGNGGTDLVTNKPVH